MKYIMCSRHFPKGHPKAGRPTGFIEKILYCLYRQKVYPKSKCVELARATGIDEHHPMHYIDTFNQYECLLPKGYTIRAGSRFNPGDMVSLRVWSDKPYRSKQIEFAQAEVKKVWEIVINMHQTSPVIFIGGKRLIYDEGCALAENDGLTITDFVSWFNIHPKKTGDGFRGQVICWDSSIEYSI